MTSEGVRGRATYHHGNLPEALVEASVELLDERGVDAFSITEVARRVGVASAAPYRHFADRAALLVAVGRYLADQLVAELRIGLNASSPSRHLAHMTSAYVRFAGERPARFLVMCGFPTHDGVGAPHALDGVSRLFREVADRHAALAGREPGSLSTAAYAAAHGYAALLVAGTFGSGSDAVARVSQKAQAAVTLLADPA